MIFAENEKIRMTSDMKKNSLPFSLIAELAGLSEKKIMALKESLKEQKENQPQGWFSLIRAI